MLDFQSIRPTGAQVFLQMPSSVQETIKTKSGATIFLPSWLDHEQYATVQAEVHSLGDLCRLPIEPDDVVLVDYRVASDYQELADGVKSFRSVVRCGTEVLWKAAPEYIIAVSIHDNWAAIGDWVLMDLCYENKMPTSSVLEIPEQFATGVRMNAGVFLSGDVPAPKGSTLLFNPEYRNEYMFPDGSKKIVLHKDYILGYL